jgi:hypothetical protein
VVGPPLRDVMEQGGHGRTLSPRMEMQPHSALHKFKQSGPQRANILGVEVLYGIRSA